MNIFRFSAILFNLSKKRRLEPPATLERGDNNIMIYITGTTPSRLGAA